MALSMRALRALGVSRRGGSQIRRASTQSSTPKLVPVPHDRLEFSMMEGFGKDVKKPPIVFVHGEFHSAWCWNEHFLPYFASKGFDSYSFSLTGYGQSKGDSNKLTLTAAVDDLKSIVGSLETPPIIIAHSAGGGVAQKFLERHHRIYPTKGLVLLASYPPVGGWVCFFRFMTRSPLLALKAMFTNDLFLPISTLDLYHSMMFSKKMTPEEVAKIYERVERRQSPRLLGDLFSPYVDRKKMPDIPIYAMGAQDDPFVSAKTAGRTAQFYDHQAPVFLNCGHNMMLDARWQDVADVTLKWIDENIITPKPAATSAESKTPKDD